MQSQDANTPEQTGTSQAEAAEALFDLLGSEEEFSEEPAEEQDAAPEDLGADDSDEDLGDDLDSEDFDAEDEEQRDESDEDGESDESEDEGLYEVTLPGGETAEVTLEELRAGYSRTQDYTRKRQRDAAEHAQLMDSTKELRDDYVERLAVLESTLRDIGPQRPSDELRASNPGEYAAQMADWQMYEQTLAAIGKERNGVGEQVSAEQAEEQQKYLQQEWNKIVDAVPAWADQTVAAQELGDIRSFAMESYGFSEDDLNAVSDARVVLMLKENMELRRGTEEARKTVQAKKAKKGRLRPGAQQNRSPNKSRRKAVEAASERASKSGSVRDAAAAISLLLDED